ncbi:phBC6A51 family helix-turn-helix protein [Paenibacillus naphthalenovorans]|uniref:phBC6A51 family helix-turn-helix protein n=1 Tax=Paenibacillus naphthalenovorans TaxID=162209 RepID=UPI003D28215F
MKLNNLTAQQKKVAQMLVDNEFGLLSEDGKKLPVDTVAEMGGIAKSTVYEWKKKPEFRAHMNELADGALDSNRAEVYAAIMKLVRGGANAVPSVKALDLYMRRFGLLTDKHLIETGEDVRRREISPEERQQALDKLDRMLDGKAE